MSQVDPAFWDFGADQRKRVRSAIKHVIAKGQSVTVARVRKLSKVGANEVAALVRMYKQGTTPDLDMRWDGTPGGPLRPERRGKRKATPKVPDASTASDPGDADEFDETEGEAEKNKRARRELEELLERVEDDEDRERCARRVAILLTRGVINASTAREIKAALGESRQAAEAARKNARAEGEDLPIPVTAEVFEATGLLMGIVSEERRGRLLQLLKREAEIDALENPTRTEETATGGGGEGRGVEGEPSDPGSAGGA